MKAFISYHHDDRAVGGQIAELLSRLGITTFLAHEDIDVSEEWRIVLLSELRITDLFIPILTKNYYASVWCVQESGIAAGRKKTSFIPLSIDGTIPQGFFAHVQSTCFDPKTPTLVPLVKGAAKCDLKFTIEALITLIGRSGSYRTAEANFELILPYIARASNEQIIQLLNLSAKNSQVYDAGLCIQKYLPPLVKSHGQMLNAEVRKKLEDTIARYAQP